MNADLCILYEDDHLLVVDKPAGLLSVPGRTPEKRDCLWSRLRERYLDREVYLVHRLDRDTSGLMVFAFTREAQRSLGRAFEKRKVRKTYVATVEGDLEAEEGEIRAPIRKDWSRTDAPVYIVCPERGKSCLTRYRVEAREGGRTRVRLFPVTGRSHQLRVHLRHIGHPIVGDPIYGTPDAGAGGLRLRAVELAFPHPVGGEELRVEG